MRISGYDRSYLHVATREALHKGNLGDFLIEGPCSEEVYAATKDTKGGGVIEGPETGLPIPAHAEIVIEDYCSPGDTKPEGPFPEWTGYYGSSSR